MRVMREYQERLWPTPWVWALAFGVVVMLAWALGFALGPVWGVATLVGGVLVVCASFAATVPRITITATQLSVRHATLPLVAIIGATPLDAPMVRETLRSPPGITFLAVRPWATQSGVLLDIGDPADPHTHWLISSRRPTALAHRILAGARDGDHGRLAAEEE